MRGDVAPLHALACLGVRIRRGGPPAGHEARPEVLVERRAAAELDEHFISRAERWISARAFCPVPWTMLKTLRCDPSSR